MPRNDIFCNHLNLTQTILSQSQIVQGYTHFFKKNSFRKQASKNV